MCMCMWKPRGLGEREREKERACVCVRAHVHASLHVESQAYTECLLRPLCSIYVHVAVHVTLDVEVRAQLCGVRFSFYLSMS